MKSTGVKTVWFGVAGEGSAIGKCISLLGLIAGADYLTFEGQPGLGVAVFVAGLVILILVHGEGRVGASGCVALLLLAISLVATTNEFCVTNFAVLAVLVVVIKALTGAEREVSLWSRGIAVLGSLINPLKRFRMLYRQLENALEMHWGGVFSRLLRILRLGLPVATLAGIFVLLLGAGNRIFGEFLEDSFGWAVDLLMVFEAVTIDRVLFWGVITVGGLSALLPIGNFRLAWLERLSWWNEPPEIAAPRYLQTLLLLVAVNVIFAVNNGVDIAFLWIGRQLPDGISYSEYVHRGVHSLTAAVLLAAVVLAAAFRQSEEIIGRRGVRAAAIFWIVQNLFLVLGVSQRLKLYADAYWLTPKRVYVIVFLFIVSAGFLLLIKYVTTRRRFAWLVRTNLVVVFSVFFALQFADVKHWVGRYNFDAWLKAPDRELGDSYFRELGPSGWPILIAMVNSGMDTPAAEAARRRLADLYADERNRSKNPLWQSFQIRRARLREELLRNGPYAIDLPGAVLFDGPMRESDAKFSRHTDAYQIIGFVQ